MSFDFVHGRGGTKYLSFTQLVNGTFTFLDILVDRNSHELARSTKHETEFGTVRTIPCV